MPSVTQLLTPPLPKGNEVNILTKFHEERVKIEDLFLMVNF